MRWPWRSRGAEPDAVERAGSAAAPAVAPPADGWRTLPPLQRTTHQAESACHLDTFPASLSTRQDPRFLEPLGHFVDPTAPAGLVEGLAQTAERGATEFPPPPRRASAEATTPGPSVQRSAAPGSPPAVPPAASPPAARQPGAESSLLAPEHILEAASPGPPEEPPVAPTIGLDAQPSEVDPGPVASAAEQPTPVQRAVLPAADLDVVTPSRVPTPPGGAPVVARTAVADTTAETPRTTGGPGSLPAVTPRPLPALPLPVVAQAVAVQREAEDPATDATVPVSEPPIAESREITAEPATPVAVDLLGERPIRVERANPAIPPPPAPVPPAPGPVVQRAASRPEESEARPAGAPSRPVLAAQRIEDSADPLPLAPPALAWPPPPPAEKQPPIRPVPAPGLTVQTVSADHAPGPTRDTQSVQRVVAEAVTSADTRVVEPAVRPTVLTAERTDPAPHTTPVPTLSRMPSTDTPVGSTTLVQRSAATTAPDPVAGRTSATSAPASPRAPSYESMPASIRSMPLQRLFSAATPQTPRGDLPTIAAGSSPGQTGHVDDHPATGGGTEVAISGEQPQASLQRAEFGGEAAGAAVPEKASPGGVAAALGSTSPAPAKSGGADLDELARRLYAPMSALLRAELWLDRERSGRSLTR